MNKILKTLLFTIVFISQQAWADDPNYDSVTRIISFPRLTVDSTDAYINGELLLKLDGTWDILAIEPEPELSLTGNWNGKLNGFFNYDWDPPVICGSISTEISLIQNDNKLTGRGIWGKSTFCEQQTGVLTGEVNGQNITFTILFSTDPAVYFDGSIADDHKSLVGVGNYVDADAPLINGSWELTLNISSE